MLKKQLPKMMAIVLLLLVWQITAWGIDYPAIFPSITNLFINIYTLIVTPEFYVALVFTVIRGLIGFSIAFILALISSTIATYSSFWKSFFYPFIVSLRSIPVISLVLIALIWFSPTNLPVFIALITMFPILYKNILSGLEQVDNRLVEMAKVFGKTRFQQFIGIYMPSAKLLIFSGISTAMGFGWRAVIIGEVLAQPLHGIGSSMKNAQVYINIAELMAWTIIAISISFFFEFGIKLIQKINFKHLYNFNIKSIITITESNEIKSISLKSISKDNSSEKVLKTMTSLFSSEIVTFLKASSGKGKTTLLRLISGLEKPDSGEIYVNKSYRFAYAFQDQRLLPWLTVAENINYGMHVNEKNKNQLTLQLLENTELLNHSNKYPHELSGGQIQRVSIARALAAKSEVLILDEPLNGLDNELKIKIITVIEEWILVNKPIVIWATHETVLLKNVEIKVLIF